MKWSNTISLEAFNSAILDAICFDRVIDIKDPALPKLARRMPVSLKGRYLLRKSSSDKVDGTASRLAIASLNQVLDDMTKASGEQQIEQHRRIAEAVAHRYPRSPDDPWWICGTKPEISEQDILSGAVVLGNIQLVKTILEKRSPAFADIDKESSYIGRPLQVAAAWGHIHLVRYLLENGANPHLHHVDIDWWSEPPIRSWPDPTLIRPDDGSALRAAILGPHEDVIQLLLQPEYRISSSKVEYGRLIVAACQIGRLDLIQTLIEATGKTMHDFPCLVEEMMWIAVYHGQCCIVEMLLDSGVDVNIKTVPYSREDCSDPLTIAARGGSPRMVRLLLERGANVEGLPIADAAFRGHIEVVELLLAHGASPVKAFLFAADGGQIRLLKWLSTRDSDLHLKPWDGCLGVPIPIGIEALHKAILIKNPAIISWLVDLGVRLDASGMNGTYEFPRRFKRWGANWIKERKFPAFSARKFSADWIVELLLSLGAEDPEEPWRIRKDVYPEKIIQKQPTRGGVRITKRTWEWVGKD